MEKTVKLAGYTFEYINELGDNIEGTDWGAVSFYSGKAGIEVIPVDYEEETIFDDEPSSFNPNTGNVGYRRIQRARCKSVSSDIRFIDDEGNEIEQFDFLRYNPEMKSDINKIIQEAKDTTEDLFCDWFDEVS